MKCAKCGYESDTTTSKCPKCNQSYTLADVLTHLIGVKGEEVLKEQRIVKSYIADLCEDNKFDKVVFDGLLSQGLSLRVLELSKTDNFNESIVTYEKALTKTYNYEKVHYIVNSFYQALTGSDIVYPEIPKPAETSPIKTSQTTTRQVTSSPAQSIPSFDQSVYIKKIKTYFNNNKKICCMIGVALLAVVLFIIVPSNGSKKKKTEDIATTAVSASMIVESDAEETESLQLLEEDSITDTVSAEKAKEYYFEATDTGIYRFAANDRTSNYDVSICVYDESEHRIFRETNEGSVNIENVGMYKIVIETTSDSCDYTLNINRPNAVITLSEEKPSLHDELTFAEQQNQYEFHAPVSGRYRIDCLNRTDGINVTVEIYDSNGKRVLKETNGGYLDMEQGVVYLIKVIYSSGACEYDLNLSIPDEIIDISAEEYLIADEISFENQINTYSYVAPVSGKYHFECSDRTNGYDVELRIYDANNKRILRDKNDGTVELEKDVKYRIEVEYGSELCTYNLAIGVPKEIQNISVESSSISDELTFTDQVNRYMFKPENSGKYHIAANNRTNDYKVEIFVYDSNEKRILRVQNEGSAELEAGTLYRIEVQYVDNLCSYVLEINRQ